MKKINFATLLTLLALPGAASAAVYSFSGGALTISDANSSDPYPASIMISGIPASETVVDVDITISNITHSFIDDVAALVGGPAGQYVVLFDGVGAESQVLDQVWVFDDGAGQPIPTGGDPNSGTWRPNDEYGSTFPSPVPDAAHPATLATFNNANPNGMWTLYVADFTAGDSGSIGGWTVRITTIPEPGVTVFLGVMAAAAGMRRRRSS